MQVPRELQPPPELPLLRRARASADLHPDRSRRLPWAEKWRVVCCAIGGGGKSAQISVGVPHLALPAGRTWNKNDSVLLLLPAAIASCRIQAVLFRTMR